MSAGRRRFWSRRQRRPGEAKSWPDFLASHRDRLCAGPFFFAPPQREDLMEVQPRTRHGGSRRGAGLARRGAFMTRGARLGAEFLEEFFEGQGIEDVGFFEPAAAGHGDAIADEAEIGGVVRVGGDRSEEHTSELQSPYDLVCRLLLEK